MNPLIYCIGHKRPVFKVPSDYGCVVPYLCQNINDYEVFDDSLGEAYNGSFLSEYTQYFALINKLKETENLNTQVYIFQYRKFLSIAKPPTLSENIPYSYVCHEHEATEYFPVAYLNTVDAESNLLGPLISIGSMAANYDRYHIIEDFIRFLISIRSTGLNERFCDLFCSEKTLLPAPALGLMSLRLHVDFVDLLMAVWSHFYNHFYHPRDGYQRRVGGFLLERLHSFLILNAIRNKQIISINQGFQIIISESKSVKRTV